MHYPHFHEYNPWADKLCYLTKVPVFLSEAYSKKQLDLLFDGKYDVYLLRHANGVNFSIGIRYGKELNEYLSPFVPYHVRYALWDHLEKIIQPSETVV